MGQLIHDRRVMRAMRDGAAYRIAEAIADGREAEADDLRDFRRYRKEHSDMIKASHPAYAKKRPQ